MSCEFCGTAMEEDALVCGTCGAVPMQTDRPVSRERLTPAVAPADDAAPVGPTCATHAGLPIIGDCPRCGAAVCYRCAPGALDDVFTCNDCVGLTETHARAPAGARCGTHPESPATFICARCGSFACSACKPEFETPGHCVRCAVPVRPKASRGSRLSAHLIDNGVIVILPILVFFLAGLLRADSSGLSPGLLLVAAAGTMLLGGAVQIWAQVHWGQSVGKHLLGIKVVRVNGDPIALWRILILRNLAIQAIAQIGGIVGLIDILLIFGDEQRCLHDHLADSIVIDVE